MSVPEIPGCIATGDTKEDAATNLSRVMMKSLMGVIASATDRMPIGDRNEPSSIMINLQSIEFEELPEEYKHLAESDT